MINLKSASRFVLFWGLTYVYGCIAFVFYCISIFIKQNHSSDKIIQPNCLSNPKYGIHKYYKNEGIKLHYVESGEEHSKLVILIHGNPGFWFCWRNQIPILAQSFKVIAIDLRGCGDSDTPEAKSTFNKEKTIQDIVFLIENSGDETAHIICNETSGYIGWELAMKYPDLVSKLVLLNSPHPAVIHQLFHLNTLHYFKYWYLLLLQISGLFEAIISPHITNKFLESCTGIQIRGKPISNEEIQAYEYNFSRREDWRGVVQHLGRIDLRPQATVKPASNVVIPILMLIGAGHSIYHVESAYRSAELAEKIKIKVIENGRSHLQVTHSKQVTEEILAFLFDPKANNPLQSQETKPSLVNRVFGAVTAPYTKSEDVIAISNGLKEAAISTGTSLAQTVWSKNSMLNKS